MDSNGQQGSRSLPRQEAETEPRGANIKGQAKRRGWKPWIE